MQLLKHIRDVCMLKLNDFILILLCFILADYTHASPTVVEEFKYYSVRVKARNEILPRFNKKSPIKEGGKVFHAHTYAYIKWNFKWETKNKKCQIKNVTTSVDVTYIYPKLRTRSVDVKLVWNKWYPKLIIHEEGHRDLAVKISKEIERVIKPMKSANCKKLEKKANNAGNKKIAKLDRLNKNYDKETNHGETQGAWLHPYLK